MRHSSPGELLDVAEGVRDEASLPHLEACAACRAQLRDVREALAGLRDAPVPEPSPLFWDHFSARVHEAVAAEAVPASTAWWRPWVLAPAAAAAGLAVAAAIWSGGTTTRGPAPAAAPTAASVAVRAADGIDGADGSDAASMAWMLELADGVDLDAAESAGLSPAVGSADAAVAELSVDEQRELEQLLEAALREPGA